MNVDAMNFSFHAPTQLVAGAGKLAETGQWVSQYGSRVLVVHGPSAQESGHLQRLQDVLAKASIEAVAWTKPAGEPDVAMTEAATQAVRSERCEVIVSLGGGSVIDLAKAAAGLVTNGGAITDYLEGVGAGKKPTAPALPHIAIPTTAGTGAEVTRNAVIRCPERQFKKSFRSPTLYPKVALLDAELTLDLPARQTAFSGMDAITQLIESFISIKATPITDALARQGLRLAIPAMRDVVTNGHDLVKREQMLLASTLSGICLANAGLGLAHGFASGLGATRDVAHGKVCAIALPYALRFNRCANFAKIHEIAQILLPSVNTKPDALVTRAIETIEQWNKDMGIPQDLSELKLTDEEIPAIVKKSMGNSMSGNPNPVTEPLAETLLKSMR